MCNSRPCVADRHQPSGQAQWLNAGHVPATGRGPTRLGNEPTPRAIAEHLKPVEAADTAYPILLDAEGRLMDGMHRAVKRLSQGHDNIWPIRLSTTPPPDFVGIAVDDLPYEDQGLSKSL